MKFKPLLISTIIFFLLVNTDYYWESELGYLAAPAFLILIVIYLVLFILLLRQLFLATRENFGNKQRILIIALLTVVLALAFFKPEGIINYEKYEGDDILIAQREGVANCMTTFKLKDNKKFTEKSVCFGMTEIKGDYTLKNDTIFFENVVLGRSVHEFYKFAVIRPSKFYTDNKHFDLVTYEDLKDTTGRELWITKNDLNK